MSSVVDSVLSGGAQGQNSRALFRVVILGLIAAAAIASRLFSVIRKSSLASMLRAASRSAPSHASICWSGRTSTTPYPTIPSLSFARPRLQTTLLTFISLSLQDMRALFMQVFPAHLSREIQANLVANRSVRFPSIFAPATRRSSAEVLKALASNLTAASFLHSRSVRATAY